MSIKNSVSPISSAIAGIMSDAASSQNKQAALVVALFESEASFNNDILLNMLRKEKAERTEARAKLIRSISEEYENACDMIEALQEKKAKERTEKETFQLTALINKVRAANIMFERAATCVVGMRVEGVQSVKSSNLAAGALEIKRKDAEGDLIKEKHSCASIQSAGKKVVDKLIGKKSEKAETTTQNPVSGMAGTIAAVSRYIEIAAKAEPAVTAITDFADETEAALETLFDKLFVLKFGPAAFMSSGDVLEYMAAKFEVPAANAKKRA